MSLKTKQTPITSGLFLCSLFGFMEKSHENELLLRLKGLCGNQKEREFFQWESVFHTNVIQTKVNDGVYIFFQVDHIKKLFKEWKQLNIELYVI